MIRQHQLLAQLAALVDAGQARTTMGEAMGTISAAHLRQAHAKLEKGAAIGKVVLVGWA